jgi:hypothetical protein
VAAAALASAALLGLSAACGEAFRAAEGPGGGGAAGAGHGGGAGAGAAGGSGASCNAQGDPCAACAVLACPEVACHCLGNDDCTGLFGCYAAICPAEVTSECAKYCMSKSPSGISQAFLYADCAHESCTAQCSWAHDAGLDDCRRCLYARCPSEVDACMSKAVCYDYLTCLAGCVGSTGCQQCAADYPEGAADAAAVLACGNTECAEPCAG